MVLGLAGAHGDASELLELAEHVSMRCRRLYISSSMARGFARRGESYRPKVGDGGTRNGGISWGELDASTSTPKARYAVPKDSILMLMQPGNVDDQPAEILHNTAHILLAQAIEAEVADFLDKHAGLTTVCNGGINHGAFRPVPGWNRSQAMLHIWRLYF
ncbi:hypothetical protein DB459_06070 [Bradyrhizobium sp. WD16]|nr:hypothetical protein DB459_06070 [Bradyrhizobium sp. WD16]